MGFLLRNISGSPLDIDDLGITIDTGDDYDLTKEPADIISKSAVDGDLESEVTGGGAIVLDPNDDATVLTIADSLACLRAANLPHFRTPTGALSSNMAGAQARRTGQQGFTTSWADVVLQSTTHQNDTAVLEVVGNEIVLKEAGPYWVYYAGDAKPVDNGSNSHSLAEARVQLNGAGSGIPDSLAGPVDCGLDSSLVGDATFGGTLIRGFQYVATADDELTLQIQRTDTDTGINLDFENAVFGAIRLTGATGAAGPAGPPGSGSSTIRTGHTYAITGEVKVPVGQTDLIVPFFVSLAPGQTMSLVKARHQIQAGTSVTADLEVNGSPAAGFSGISITTTPTDTDPSDVVLSNNDEIALVVTAVSGTPQNMTFTIFLESTN